MIANDSNPTQKRPRWHYFAVLLLLVVLCLAAFAASGRLLGISGASAGSPTLTPTLTNTPQQDTPTATITETAMETEEVGGVCLTPCDPEQSVCDDGLSCVRDNQGKFVCWGGTDSTGRYCGPTAEQNCACEGPDYICTVSGGESTTSPNDPRCVTTTELATCECSGADYICTNADGSIASASYNSVTCGGSGNCECRGPDLACPDGTYAQFNPQCMDSAPPCTCVFYCDSTCRYTCAESGAACTP